MSKVIVFTDGACAGNPGPGGYAAKLFYPDGSSWVISAGVPNTTNNRMELEAAIKALDYLLLNLEGRPIEIHTDSTYLKRGMNEWLATWKKNGWRAASGKPIKNPDQWKELDRLNSTLDVKWNWVPAHAGIPENEEVDRIAVAESQAIRRLQ